MLGELRNTALCLHGTAFPLRLVPTPKGRIQTRREPVTASLSHVSTSWKSPSKYRRVRLWHHGHASVVQLDAWGDAVHRIAERSHRSDAYDRLVGLLEGFRCGGSRASIPAWMVFTIAVPVTFQGVFMAYTISHEFRHHAQLAAKN